MGIKANNEWKIFNGYKIPFSEYKFIEEINENLGIKDDDWAYGNSNNMTKYVGFEVNNDHITKLYLKEYLLPILPDSIGDLTFLEELSLKGNWLEKLPESFGKLRNLKNLYIYNNHLAQLPEDIGDLKNLEALDLRHNKLTKLQIALEI